MRVMITLKKIPWTSHTFQRSSRLRQKKPSKRPINPKIAPLAPAVGASWWVIADQPRDAAKPTMPETTYAIA